MQALYYVWLYMLSLIYSYISNYNLKIRRSSSRLLSLDKEG